MMIVVFHIYFFQPLRIKIAYQSWSILMLRYSKLHGGCSSTEAWRPRGMLHGAMPQRWRCLISGSWLKRQRNGFQLGRGRAPKHTVTREERKLFVEHGFYVQHRNLNSAELCKFVYPLSQFFFRDWDSRLYPGRFWFVSSVGSPEDISSKVCSPDCKILQEILFQAGSSLGGCWFCRTYCPASDEPFFMGRWCMGGCRAPRAFHISPGFQKSQFKCWLETFLPNLHLDIHSLFQPILGVVTKYFGGELDRSRSRPPSKNTPSM